MDNTSEGKTITDLISEIKVDKANLEHIAQTGKINGSLFIEIQDKMRAFASQELQCAIPHYEINLQKDNIERIPFDEQWKREMIQKYSKGQILHFMETASVKSQKEIYQLKQYIEKAYCLLRLSTLTLSDDINTDSVVKRLNDEFIKQINEFLNELKMNQIV